MQNNITVFSAFTARIFFEAVCREIKRCTFCSVKIKILIFERIGIMKKKHKIIIICCAVVLFLLVISLIIWPWWPAGVVYLVLFWAAVIYDAIMNLSVL